MRAVVADDEFEIAGEKILRDEKRQTRFLLLIMVAAMVYYFRNKQQLRDSFYELFPGPQDRQAVSSTAVNGQVPQMHRPENVMDPV